MLAFARAVTGHDLAQYQFFYATTTIWPLQRKQINIIWIGIIAITNDIDVQDLAWLVLRILRSTELTIIKYNYDIKILWLSCCVTHAQRRYTKGANDSFGFRNLDFSVYKSFFCTPTVYRNSFLKYNAILILVYNL